MIFTEQGAVELIKIENIYTFYCSVCAAFKAMLDKFA